MQKVSLTIRVDREDLGRWKAQSGGNLSEWIRERCNKGSVVHTGSPEPAPETAPGVPESVPPLKRRSISISVRVCPHGVESGWRCTLCGGKVP